MKRIVKMLLAGIVCAAMLTASACTFSLGSYEVTFVDYKGNYVNTRLYGVNEAVSLSNAPYVPARNGFTHPGWRLGEDVAATKAGTKTYWPTYRLDESALCWNASGCKMQWYGESATYTVYLQAGIAHSILVKDESANTNFSLVTVLMDAGDLPDVTSFLVYDEGGTDLGRRSTSP